jgi:hypothetical protein
MEEALHHAKAVSHIVGNPAFVELYEEFSGKELNGKLIRSKYDLLGILASGAKLTMMEDKAEIQTPIEVRLPVEEELTEKLPIWMIVAVVSGACALLVILFFAFRGRKASRDYVV